MKIKASLLAVVASVVLGLAMGCATRVAVAVGTPPYGKSSVCTASGCLIVVDIAGDCTKPGDVSVPDQVLYLGGRDPKLRKLAWVIRNPDPGFQFNPASLDVSAAKTGGTPDASFGTPRVSRDGRFMHVDFTLNVPGTLHPYGLILQYVNPVNNVVTPCAELDPWVIE